MEGARQLPRGRGSSQRRHGLVKCLPAAGLARRSALLWAWALELLQLGPGCSKDRLCLLRGGSGLVLPLPRCGLPLLHLRQERLPFQLRRTQPLHLCLCRRLPLLPLLLRPPNGRRLGLGGHRLGGALLLLQARGRLPALGSLRLGAGGGHGSRQLGEAARRVYLPPQLHHLGRSKALVLPSFIERHSNRLQLLPAAAVQPGSDSNTCRTSFADTYVYASTTILESPTCIVCRRASDKQCSAPVLGCLLLRLTKLALEPRSRLAAAPRCRRLCRLELHLQPGRLQPRLCRRLRQPHPAPLGLLGLLPGRRLAPQQPVGGALGGRLLLGRRRYRTLQLPGGLLPRRQLELQQCSLLPQHFHLRIGR